jgi:hypothetical protein
MKYLTLAENLCHYILFEFPADTIIQESCKKLLDSESQGKKEVEMSEFVKNFSDSKICPEILKEFIPEFIRENVIDRKEAIVEGSTTV